MGSTAGNFTFDTVAVADTRQTARTAQDDRRFFGFLLFALLLHALFLVRIQTSEPRRLGAPGGADDAISVSIITEQDLTGRATVEDRAAGTPAPPPAAPQATPQPPPPETAQAESQPPSPAEPAAAVPPPPPPPNEAPAAEPAPPAALRPTLPDEAIEPAPQTSEKKAAAETKPQPEKAETTKPANETPLDTSKLLEIPEPKPKAKSAEKPVEPKPKETKPKPEAKPAPKTETAKLDLTPPAVFQAPVGGGGAGVQRPAGITRSGENDDFARGVIRALQTTMPQLRNTFGRVTVRIELDMKGNLVRTTVLRPSNITGLDQSVVFATKQSSFPFPPYNAVPADLVFFVTYIYR